MKRNNGFTLAEVLFATSISALVAMGVLAMFAMGNRTWREASASVTLQSNGRLILNQIARGSHGEYGLREANYNTLTIEEDGSAIQFVIDKNEPPTYEADDDTVCRFYLENERVWYDPNTASSGDEYPIASNGRVEDISFVKDGSCVTVELTMKDYGSYRAEAYTKLSTNIFLRKARQVLH